jgi:hypothetical protein
MWISQKTSSTIPPKSLLHMSGRKGELSPDYQEFNYQAAIDMLDKVGCGLLARLASEVSDLKCDFIAVNDEADVQDFSENGYEVAGLEQPIDISDDDEAVAEVVDQVVFQNMYTEVVGGDDDDSVEAALGL